MAELLSVQKVVDDGMHNAVTDLVRWRAPEDDIREPAPFWLAYRRGHRHETFPPGEVVLLRSPDAERWETVARVTSGLDDRDPKLVPDGARLRLFFGSHDETRTADGELVAKTPRHLVSQTCVSDDGRRWSLPRQVFGPSWWLWAPKRFGDGFWSTAYGSDVSRDGSPMEVILAHSPDGETWRRHATLLEGRRGNEGALHRFDDGRMLAVVRGVGEETHLLEAREPFRDWSHATVPHWMHAPALGELGGRLVCAGRDRAGDDYVTRLWELDGVETRPLLDLPSGGDTSYCGLAEADDGTLVVSYYSQHEFRGRPDFRICEKPSAVYVARVRL